MSLYESLYKAEVSPQVVRPALVVSREDEGLGSNIRDGLFEQTKQVCSDHDITLIARTESGEFERVIG